MSASRSLSRRAPAALLAVAVGATGCSAIWSRPPPAHPLASPDACSRSRAPVVADAIAAAYLAATGVILFGAAAIEDAQNQNQTVPSWNNHPLTVDRGLLIGGTLSLGAVAGLIVSADYGLHSARACDRARAELELTPTLPRVAPVSFVPWPWPAR